MEAMEARLLRLLNDTKVEFATKLADTEAALNSKIADLQGQVSDLQKRDALVQAVHKRELVDLIRQGLVSSFGKPDFIDHGTYQSYDWDGFLSRLATSEIRLWAQKYTWRRSLRSS